MVLKQFAWVYDTLGMVVPYILTAKSLMRTLCQENANNCEDWDKPLFLEMKKNGLNFSKVFLIWNF